MSGIVSALTAGLGGAAGGSSFLGGLGSMLSGVSGMASLLGMGKDRISNRDYQFYQDLADSGNPREIKRQSAFLEGLAPAQANAYNSYQDSTYAQDTQRQTDRIQSMAGDLKMSPWEITGSSGASPLPSPVMGSSPGNGSGASNNFMQMLAPLKIAEMNNQTSLMNTKMQTDTQRAIASQSTAGGQLPIANTAQAAAQRLLTEAATINTQAQTGKVRQETQTEKGRTDLTWTQASAADNAIVLDAITKLLPLLPTTEINTGLYNTREVHGYKELLNLANTLGDTARTPEAVANAIRSMPPKQWGELESEVIQLASVVAKGAKTGLDIVGSAAGFLGGLFPRETITETDDNSGRSTYSRRTTRRRR